MTETNEAAHESGRNVEAELDLHKELIQGTLEVVLGITEAGQDLETHAKEIARLSLDNTDRLDTLAEAMKLQNVVLQAMVKVNQDLLGRVETLESEVHDLKKSHKGIQEQNGKLTVANIEIRQVLYGQMTLEEWDEKASKRDKG